MKRKHRRKENKLRPKEKAICRHARKRAEERFGVELLPDVHNCLVNQIQGHGATFLKRESNRVSVWQVTLLGEKCKAVYDNQRKLIVTLIPLKESKACAEYTSTPKPVA